MSNTKVFLRDQVRVYVTDVTDVAQTAIEKHKSTPLPSLALATAIAVFGPLGVMKKYGRTAVMLKGDGPLKNVLVETNVDGEIRALVGDAYIITEYDKEKFNDIPLTLGVGQTGLLRITHEVNGHTFGGDVKLAKGDIVTDLAWYFDQSEQIYSAIISDVELASPEKIKRAYSVIFQMLPKHTEGDVLWVEEIVKNKKLKDYASLEEWTKVLGVKELESHKLEWKCTCSRERVKAALDSLTEAEKEEVIAKHSKLEVTCNFCNTHYDFTNDYK